MVTFKLLAATDIETIIPLMKEFYAIDGYPMDVAIFKDLFSEFISDGKLGKGWLIFLENEAIGYVILTFVLSFEYQGKVAFIDELYVSERFRGRGIGKNTLAFIKLEAEKSSVKMLYLEVERHNSNAQKLYLASGFKMTDRNFMQYKIQ